MQSKVPTENSNVAQYYYPPFTFVNQSVYNMPYSCRSSSDMPVPKPHWKLDVGGVMREQSLSWSYKRSATRKCATRKNENDDDVGEVPHIRPRLFGTVCGPVVIRLLDLVQIYQQHMSTA